jgi:transglutaminase-like putative cysteine protease
MIIFRPLTWLIQRIGWSNLLTLVLLLIALGSLVWTIADVVRGLGLELLLPITVISVLLGWGLARLKPIPWWLAGGLIVILGTETIIIRLAGLAGQLITLGQQLLLLAWGVWWWPLAGPPDVTPLGLTLVELWVGLNAILSRLLTWAGSLAGSVPAFDPVATTLVWSIALWLICGWAGWAIQRLAHPLAALTPAGVLLATILAYRPAQATNLIPMLIVILLLLGFTGHFSRERRWLAKGVDFAQDIRTDLGFVIIPVALLLALAAGLMPSISIRELARLFQQPFRGPAGQAEPLVDSLGLDRQPEPEPVYLQEYRAPGLPRRHLLGSGPELSEQVALLINTGQTPIPYQAGFEGESNAPRYYWRSLTYDRYSGLGWRTSDTERESYEAGEEITLTASLLRRVLRQRVRTLSNQGGRLHFTGDLITTDQDFNIDRRASGDIFAVTGESREYRVDALIPAAPFTEEQLRAAGTTYPEWLIESQYFSLSDSVPDRVLALALELTATEPTPYDRARAIETYLRRFPYSLDLPEPPANRDVVDYFLFDLQKGYCDYYATAMVVLARAAGLPARLAVGYASGVYDPTTAEYVVTEAEAHSWPEIYFPEYGWIEFEPTAAQPVPDRSAQAPRPEFAGGPLPPLEPAEPKSAAWTSLWWLSLPGGVVLTAAGAATWLLVDGWRLRRLSPAVAAALLYERLQNHGRRLAVPTWRGDTPYEYTESLTARVEALGQGRRWGALLRPATQEVRWLADLYVRTSYSPRPPDSSEQGQAIQTWQRLQQRLWLAWFSTLSARGRRNRS